MSREEAIDLLDNLIGFIEDNHGSDYDKAFKIAIKALEQENVLDKIRAEIEDVAFDSQEIDGEHESFMIVYLDDVLQIIDKYKAESEG